MMVSSLVYLCIWFDFRYFGSCSSLSFCLILFVLHNPTHLPFVVPSSTGPICRLPANSPSFPAKPSRASRPVQEAKSASSNPPRFPSTAYSALNGLWLEAGCPRKFASSLRSSHLLPASLAPRSVPLPSSSVSFFPQWIINVVVADTICKALDGARCGYAQVR